MRVPLRFAAALLTTFAVMPSVHSARADTLAEVRARGVLRWGGDASGGGPYIYQGSDNQLTGFEFELAD